MPESTYLILITTRYMFCLKAYPVSSISMHIFFSPSILLFARPRLIEPHSDLGGHCQAPCQTWKSSQRQKKFVLKVENRLLAYRHRPREEEFVTISHFPTHFYHQNLTPIHPYKIAFLKSK